MTIRTRVILETVLILAFVVSGTGFTFISVREQRIALDRVGLAADTVANRSIALIKAAKDIKLDVVQVQQFLTDISATRAQDGLDDGFKVAQEFAERFEHDAETAVGLAESLHRPEMIRLLTETKAVFTPYYETGRRMAQGLHRRRSGAGQSNSCRRSPDRRDRHDRWFDRLAGGSARAATEIARNVSETALAVNTMIERTAEASAEAAKTGQHAVEVKENATGLDEAMGELRHSVIRVVRTSTADVNRRLSVRRPIDLSCRLRIPGQGTESARIADISKGGARVDGGPPLAAGARGELCLDGVNLALPFIVHGGEHEVLHLAFELDAALAGRFGFFLDGRATPPDAR